MRLLKNLNPAIAAVVAVALVAALLLLFLPGGGTKKVTADFPRTISLYEGSDVKILGVAVGKVDKVTPMGTKVRVEMSYDADQKVPADAEAAVVSPSIVGDRYVQFTPVYTGGPVMADNATLGTDRTSTPLELDEIFGSLNQLNIALGPEGANKDGALTRLLDTTARNFGGQGVQFNETLTNLGKLTKTLANNKDELFDTTTQIGEFVETLSRNDDTVRRFNDSLAAGADMLEQDRQELGAALRNLSVALVQVQGFVKENREALTTNVRGLTRISNTIVKNRDHLEEILHIAPLALNNLMLAYNPATGTLDTRDNVGELANQLSLNPGDTLCAFINSATTTLPDCPRDVIDGLLGPIVGNIPLPRTAPFAEQLAQQADEHRQQVDTTLAGLVGEAR